MVGFIDWTIMVNNGGLQPCGQHLNTHAWEISIKGRGIVVLSFSRQYFIFGQCSKYQNCWLSYNFDRDDSDYRKTLSVRFEIGVRQRKRDVIQAWRCFVQSRKYFVFICLTCTLDTSEKSVIIFIAVATQHSFAYSPHF